MKWTPAPHQKEGVKRLVKNNCQGLFWKPGLSKTSPVISAFSKLQKKGVVGRGLVISNNEIISKGGPWHGEVEKWDAFNHLNLVTLHGAKKDELVKKDADIYLISCHVSSLEWFFYKNELHKKLGIDWLIVDESSFFKNSTSACFKGYPRVKRKIVRFPGLRFYVPWFTRRTILTGDPRTNGLEDLWSQIYLLDEGAQLGAYKSHFVNKFFSVSYNGWDKTPLPSAEKHIYKLIEDLVHIVDDDVLELPSLKFHKVVVTLPKKARAIYDQMLKKFVAETVKGEKVVAASKAVSGGYLRQIANGSIYYKETTLLKDGRELKGPQKTQHIHYAKNKALLELLGSVNYKQIIIAYEFEHDLKRIKKALTKLESSLNIIYYTTKSEKKKVEIKKAWNAGTLDVLVTQITRLSHGLNLQASNAYNICLYSQSWRVESINQLIRRLRRRGSGAECVNVFCIVAKDTVDEMVFKNMDEKNVDQQKLFDELKKYVLTARNEFKVRKC